MSEKKCVCGHELESRGYQVLELHGESLLKDYMDAVSYTHLTLPTTLSV